MSKNKIDILEALDISALPQDEQEELLLDLQSLVYKGSLIRLIEKMDEETQEKFNSFLDTNPDEEAVMAFIYEHIADADSVVKETLADIQSDILAVTGNK